ncbi:hypothetical protein WDU94_004762 [Cyamophila willieti]
MALSYMRTSRCLFYLQKIVMQQAILASAKAFPYGEFTSSRHIMTTPHNQFCHPSTHINNIPQIQLDDFEKHLKNKTCVIDVREPGELQETGIIPNSVNIPLGEVRDAFELSPEQFERKYKCSKPSPDQTVVFTCRSGKRSHVACELLHKQGYERVINYCDGWLGWEEKLKQDQQEQRTQ